MADATPAAPSGEDWPAQAADTIVKVVGQVRDRTTGTVLTAGRAVVYGLLAAVVGSVALVLFFVLLARGMIIGIDLLLGIGDLDRPGRAVWITHLLLGLGFGGFGLKLWQKATSTPAA